MSVRTVLLVLMVLMVVQAAVSMAVSSIQGRPPSWCHSTQCKKYCPTLYGDSYIKLKCRGDMCVFDMKNEKDQPFNN